MYGLDLYLQKNRTLVAKTQKVVEAAFPVVSPDGKTRVEAANVRVVWDGQLAPLGVHQAARQTGGSVTVPIVADISLFRDDKKVQSLKNFKLGELPLLSKLGTFMVNGGDYFTPNQLRLKPGAYTREMANGQIETFINLKGRPVRLWMEPEKGVVKLGYGSSNVDFVPIMQAIGISNADLIAAFGGGKRGLELLEKNMSRNPDAHVEKLLRAIMERKQNRDLVRAGLVDADSPVDRMSYQERVQELRSWFGRQKVDAFVSRKTLGHPFDTLSPDMLLGSVKKLLGVSRQEVKPDDRDSLEFKTLHSADDMIPERIANTMRMLGRKLLQKLNRPEATIARGFGKNWLNTATMGYFGASPDVEGGLAHTAEAANPLAILSEHSKTTLMGEGGIGDERAVSNAARLFRPVATSYIDPVHTPEGCFGPYSEVYTTKGWVRWDAVTVDHEFACMVDGKLEYHKPLRMIAAPYAGRMVGYKSDRIEFFVTPNHRMWVRPQDCGAKYRIVEAGKLPGTNRNVMTGGHAALPGTIAEFVLPAVTARGAGTQNPGKPPVGAHLNPPAPPIDIVDWCRFLGWYLSEGNISSVTSSSYCTTITQLHSSKAECAHIAATLDRLPFTWTTAGDRRFHISGKQLNAYLAPLGKSRTERVPHEVFTAPPEARLAFLEAALMGDGRKRTKGERGSNPLSRWICYCTTSKQLADDVYRLMFELGLSASISFEPDERDPKYLGCYCVQIHSFNERQLTSKNHRHPEGMYYSADYVGNIYCAEVPGGLMYCRHGTGHGFWIGNSAIGITTHLAWNTTKTDDNHVTTKMYKVENGVISKVADVTVEEASDAIVAYPETWENRIGGKAKSDKVRANVNGEIEMVDAKDVQYVILSGRAMLDHTSNAAAFFHHTHANRGMMAGKHLTQALPLVARELPLSDIKDDTGKSVLENLALPFVVRSSVDGTVTRIEKDAVYVGETKHEIFDSYPMQAKVGIEHQVVVKVGDKVKKGQLLADTNYSREGKLALGVNVRTAYTPWKNAGNFEDAIVISESAAKKFSSMHIHRLEIDTTTKDLTVGKKIAQAQFPTIFTSDNWQNLDDSGVIKEGSVVKPGQVVIAAVKKNLFDAHDRSAKNLASIHKSLERPYSNASVTWDEDFPGTVLRVVRTGSKIEVHLKTEEPSRVGDKLSMSSAAKGTIAQIIPDDKMPRDSKGRHIEVILNPHGVAGRINPSQTIEQAAGKLIRDHGVKYDHALFDDVDHPAELKKLLAERGDSHTEKLFDPETGRHTEDPVAVGYNYMFKLDHPVRKKFSARERDGYTMDETPTAGKGRGGQSYDQLTTYALLGHNAHAILGESFGTRGVKNDEFWHAYQAGETPPPPKVPFVFEKFRSMLNAAGVDTKQHGNVLHYLPMTEKRVLEMSNGKIEKANALRARGSKALDVVEEKGGLFDVQRTGGLKGDRWTHLELDERIPHPLYEKVIRDVTGLKTADFYGILAHSTHIDSKTGKVVEPSETTLTGEAAFKKLLSFDIDEKAKELKQRLRTAVGSDANKLNRAHRYLMGLKESGLKPDEAYLTKVVPILPPKFRPVVEMNGGALRVADANLLYRDAILANNQLAQGKASGVPGEMLKDSRLNVYKAVGALVGVNNALTHRDDRDEARGLIDVIKGRSNKEGLFQRMLARRRNDYTGRSTIEPDASLGVDEIGIPEDMAWKIYKPTVVRRMVLGGWKPADAAEEVEKRSMAAIQALDAEMKDRPVLYNRAPSLHKWSVNSAFAYRTPGKELKISPAVIGPFNADFDGDTMSVTVPITDAAKREAHDLLPSRNLKYDKDRSLAYGLEKDVITGLFVLTRGGVDSGKTFNSEDEAIAAYRDPKNNLRMDSMVQIKGKTGRQAIGWLLFQQVVPSRFLMGISPPIDGKKLEKLLDTIATSSPADFNLITRRIAQAGFNAAAAKGGITSSIDELAMDRSKVNRLIDQLDQDVKKIREQKLPQRDQNKKLKEVHDKYVVDINKEVGSHLDSVGHGYSQMMQARMSGKINPDQFRQMLASPLLMTDVYDNTVPAVITSNYGRGMKPSDYILTTPGARKGMVGKSLSTAQPGFLAKEIAGNLSPVRITTKDCNTQNGVNMLLNDAQYKNYDVDLLDRHLLKDIPGTSYKRNDPVTPEMLSRLRDMKKTTIWVRSPMTCQANPAPCQLCAGRDASGVLHPIGSNIGLNYGQTVSERSTQLILKSFHSGGTLGSGDSLSQGFARLRELLSAPETVREQGTLADIAGRVHNIRPAPQGGSYVTILGTSGSPKEHYVAAGRVVKVKVGDTVEIGDPLSDGSYRPQELAQKKGLLAAQQYVVSEARKAYQQAGAVVRMPVVEVLAAGTMRYVKITNDGDEDGLAIGDVIPEQVYDQKRAKNPRIKAVPELPGLGAKPLMSTDLMERLNFQRLEDAVREIPAIGGKSDLTGASGSPMAGFAYGIAFRPGEAAHQLKAAELTGPFESLEDDAF